MSQVGVLQSPKPFRDLTSHEQSDLIKQLFHGYFVYDGLLQDETRIEADRDGTKANISEFEAIKVSLFQALKKRLHVENSVKGPMGLGYGLKESNEKGRKKVMV